MFEEEVVLDPLHTESLAEVDGCPTFGSVTLLVHSHTVYAKCELADKAVQVPPSAFSESKLPPAPKFILQSRREALQWA